MQSPLGSYRIISTGDADVAQSVVSRELTGSKIQKIGNSKKFRFDMNGASFGDTLVAWNAYQTEIDIHSGRVDDTIGLIIGEQTPVFKMDDKTVACTQRQGALVSQSQMSVHRPAGSSIIVLKTSYSALDRRFREISGRAPKGRIRFDRSVDLSSGPGALARQTLMNIVSLLETDSAIVTNELLRVAMDEMLLATLLSLPHNHAEQLQGDSGDVAPHYLYRAEEFIEAHFAEPIKIRDVVQVCGCSASLLHRAFQKYRDYTPAQFLAGQRLDAARRRLLSVSPNATVTSIALDCGFVHLSRFSANYRQRFGESPSETLRRGR